MTTNHELDTAFEAEVRASFKRHLSELDRSVPAPRPATAMPRVHARRPLATRGTGIAAIAAALVLAAVLVVPPTFRSAVPAASATPGSSASASPGTSVDAVTQLTPHVIASFGSDDLQGAVLGANGAAYVLDATTQTVYRVDPTSGTRVAVYWAGMSITGNANGGVAGKPRLITTGGFEVLILDDANSLWRWHEATGDTTGRGTLTRVDIPDAANWGPDVRAIGAFTVNQRLGQYNIYVVDPQVNQVLKYPVSIDGSTYPTSAMSRYLAQARDLSAVDDLYLDGDIVLLDGGKAIRYQRGQAVPGWAFVDDPRLPKASHFTRLAADSELAGEGNFFAYDQANRQISEFRKSDGTHVATFRAPSALDDARSLAVLASVDGSADAYWCNGGSLVTARLRGRDISSGGPGASATPATSATPEVSATPVERAPSPTIVTSFGDDQLGSALVGYDGRAYVIDETDGKVYQVDLSTRSQVAIDIGPAAAKPRKLAVWNQGLLIIDSASRIWLWSPVSGDKTGRGDTSPVTARAPSSLRSICVGANPANVGPSANEAETSLAYAVSPSGVATTVDFTWKPYSYSLTSHPELVDQIYVDDALNAVFLVESGRITLYKNGIADPARSFQVPADAVGASPAFTLLTGDQPSSGAGLMYAYDRAHKRVVAFANAGGQYIGSIGSPGAISDVGSLFVASPSGVRTLYWTSDGHIWSVPVGPAFNAENAAAP